MLRRILLCVLMTASLLLGSMRLSSAQSEASFRDLATGTDFRLRVAAALALGKSKNPNARPALEKALGDPHPAVRAAAAVGLGTLGDDGAVAALRAAATKETAPNVKSQLLATIQRLSNTRSSSNARTKFLVLLGRMENKSGVNTANVSSAFKDATRSKVAQVPGVEVLAEGADAGSASRARNLPAFAIDGSLTQLAKGQEGKDVAYSARVTYVIRKVPEQQLKGTISGTAQAAVDARAVKGAADLSQLQLDALSAAVDSAFKGAPPALEAASIK